MLQKNFSVTVKYSNTTPLPEPHNGRKCDWVGTVGRDYRTNPTNPSPKGGLCYALEEF